MPQYARPLNFIPATLNEEARTVEATWSTGAQVLRASHNDPYYEELSLDPTHVDLTRLNSGAPVLDTHNASGITRQIGVVEKAWIALGEARALLRFSKRDDVEPIFADIKDGILRNLSVGYWIHQVRENERTRDGYRSLLATRWEPFEISLVPVGADPGATVRSHPLIERTHLEEDPTTAERARIKDIMGITEKFGMERSLSQELIDSGATTDAARTRVLDELAKRSEANEIRPTPVEMIRDERDTKREGMIEALAHRHRAANRLTEKGRSYRTMSLLEMARHCAGINTSISKEEAVTRAFHSTSDFPEILGSVAKQQLQASYERLVQRQNFWPLARVKSAPDFKPMRRVRIGEMPSLKEMPEGAEYTYGTLGEGAEEYRITTWGRALGITRQMVINDDLGALDTLGNWGAAVARLESQLFWSIFNENQRLSDGVPLFDAKHKNVGKAAELSIASLSEARIAMAKQQGIDARPGDYLDLQAEHLIVPVELQTAAEQFLSREVIPQQPDGVNPFKGAFKLIVASWLKDPKQWYLAAGVDQGVDLIEMAYLDGQRRPHVEWQHDFDTDSLRVKARMDVAAKAIDYRGLYRGA